MMERLNEIVTKVDDFVWGPVMLILLVGTGIFLTIRTKFLPWRNLGYALKSTLSKEARTKSRGEGDVSPFSALTTALAATIGTGNIVGVATAMVSGGPGALVWMWISAAFGISTKYAECALAGKYRRVNKKGEMCGGPMYTLKYGLKNKKLGSFLAVIFAIFTLMASFGIGNSAQGNSITTAVSSTFNVPKWIVGIILVICVGAVVIGGIKSISKVSSVLVPAMAVFYMIAGILVVCINYKNVPSGIANIFSMAFGAKPIAGGLVGTVTASMMNSMRYGIARGVFSNEAGLGTGSIAHACADTKKPVKQGFFGIFEVFVDTIVICTLTALVILCSGVSVGYGEAAGAELTISGFTSTYGGWVSIFTAVAMCCFAFSTIIGWGLYGTRCIEFLFGTKANKPFMVVYSLVAIVGATMNLGLMWSIAETFNGLMVIPNLIAVFLLSGVVVKLVKEYLAGEGAASTLKNSREEAKRTFL